MALGVLGAHVPKIAPPSVTDHDISIVDLPAPSRTRRQFAAFAGVLIVVVAGIAVVQYTDPTRPDVGDGPEYAGADAPSVEQVQQAQERSRSASRTVRTEHTYVNQSGSRRTFTYLMRKHDLERDLALVWHPDTSLGYPKYITEDRGWILEEDNETPTDTIHEAASPGFYYKSIWESFYVPDRARVVEATNDAVIVTYEVPASAGRLDLDVPGNRTVRIDRSQGRIRSVRTVYALGNASESPDPVVVEHHFSLYGQTTVEHRTRPFGPLVFHVHDLLNGP